MGLKEYKRKRDFEATPEPEGREHEDPAVRSFCIQKHAATRLHYDFRLEMEGVLRSWAVPKGPSLDPSVKRLAAHVEDHPLEYGSFEGIIPKGQYGGGTVVLWDRGTWKPEGDPVAAYRKGRMRFHLDGEKLHGEWLLVKMGGKASEDGKNWMLMKVDDAAAQPEADYDIAAARPESVVTGRTLDEIAENPDRVWQSNRAESKPGRRSPKAEVADAVRGGRKKAAAPRGRTVAPAPPAAPKAPARPRSSATPRKAAAPDPSDLPGARPARLPLVIPPQLATLVTEAPTGDDWLHEIKFDGYRAAARISRGATTFTSRNGKDWTRAFGRLGKACAALPVDEAYLDGEVVVHEKVGVTSFQALQQALGAGRDGDLVFHVFDLLHLDGTDLTGVALEDRKVLLASILAPLGEDGSVRYAEHVVGRGDRFHSQACQLALEGIISKRRHAPYREGRGKDWLKVKCQQRQELIVVGYSEPAGSRSDIGALLLGVHDGGELRFAGRVGTGFSAADLASLRRRLAPLEITSAPVVNPPKGAAARGVHWVEPQVVAEVQFTNWTDEGVLRHPSFQGLREDKAAADVVRERARAAGDVEAEPVSRAPAARKRAPAVTPAEPPVAVPEKRPRNPRHVKPEASVSKRTRPTLKDEVASAAKAGRARRAKSSEAADAGGAAPARKPASKTKTGERVEVGGVSISNPGRVLYPESGVTKLDVARYYETVEKHVLPHVVGRPLTLVRCPEGIAGEAFYQKHSVAGLSKAVKRVPITEKSGTSDYLYVEDLEGLLSFVQMGALEFHVWGSRVGDLERPDFIVFDLDPDPTVTWERVVESTFEVRASLEALGLQCFLKTTGGKGLHVVAPLKPRLDWDEVKPFTKAVVEELSRIHPGQYTTVLSKEKRKGRIFLDYLRNGRGATAVCAYSTRARKGATVATPIEWDELSPALDPSQLTTRSVPERLARRKRDPWAGWDDAREPITAAMLKAVRTT